MSWDYTVYCKRPTFHRGKLDAVYKKLAVTYGGGPLDDDETDEDEAEDGEAAYGFDGFTLRVFENPAGCTIEVWSQDGFAADASDVASACMEELADALGGSVEEEVWLAKSAAIDAKTAKKRVKTDPWLTVPGPPGTSRFLAFDASGKLLSKKILTSDALFGGKPESKVLTAEGRKQDGVRKMEVIEHDASGNPVRRTILTYDAEGTEIARDDSGRVQR